ncbi:arabinofuranosidase catalytic domain-containing protein [Myxosarcina sp. GI1(2024)]
MFFSGIYESSRLVLTPLLLDTYGGAYAAYSTKKLRTAYSGDALRVRRSSDNVEQDIGFIDNNLDVASLQSFVGSSNGFVVTWYDQSTNSRHITQSIIGKQPRIVNGGTVQTIKTGYYGVRFDGSDDFLGKNGLNTSAFSTLSTSFVHSPFVNSVPDVGHGTLLNFNHTLSNSYIGYFNNTGRLDGETWAHGGISGNRIGSTTSWSANDLLISEFYSTNNKTFYNNVEQTVNKVDTQGTSATYTPSAEGLNTDISLKLGMLDANGNFLFAYSGSIGTAIIWDSNTFASRSSIHTILNTH